MESVHVRNNLSVSYDELTTLRSNSDIPALLNAATLKNAPTHLEMVRQHYTM